MVILKGFIKFYGHINNVNKYSFIDLKFMIIIIFKIANTIPSHLGLYTCYFTPEICLKLIRITFFSNLAHPFAGL